jgi:hypothetical protein
LLLLLNLPRDVEREITHLHITRLAGEGDPKELQRLAESPGLQIRVGVFDRFGEHLRLKRGQGLLIVGLCHGSRHLGRSGCLGVRRRLGRGHRGRLRRSNRQTGLKTLMNQSLDLLGSGPERGVVRTLLQEIKQELVGAP